MRRLFTIVSTLVVVVAMTYFTLDWAYWRNWLAWDMVDPNRAVDVDKYVSHHVLQIPPPHPIQLASSSKRTLSAQALQELETLSVETESLVFLVSHRERLQFSYYAEGIGPETLLDSYSMHKGLLALIFGYAIDNGDIQSIDTPASRYLPEWQHDGRQEITIRELLNNESGLKRLDYSSLPHNAVLDFFIGRDLRKLTFSFPLDFAPGTLFEFNHVNSQALYFVLVRSTGREYVDILSDYLWRPLGNGSARVVFDHEGGAARTICCFLATAPSWIRIGTLLNGHGKIGNHQIVSKEWIDEMLRPAPQNPNYGFNVWIGNPFSGKRLHSAVRGLYREITGPFDVSDVYFMEASGNGRLYFVPSQDVVIFRIGRRIADQKWDDGKTVNTVLRGIIGQE